MSNWISNLFKSKPKEPPFNIHHPDVAANIEFAFEAGPAFKKRKYYRTVNDFKLPTGRYKWLDAFLYEAELRMNLPTMNKYLDEIEKALDGTKGEIKLSKAFQVIWAMRSRTKLAFEPATIKRLASVVYFDETEDLSDYNQDYCEEKVKFWEKHGCYDFFLTRPIEELLNLKGTSVESLKTYMRQAEQVIRDLTLDPEKVS
jgi:hypothetical protein